MMHHPAQTPVSGLEHNRTTAYRKHVLAENFVGSLRVFCGFLGLGTLFMLALVSLINDTEGGLFGGGLLAVLWRFGKFGFLCACLWGLLLPWTNYSDENGKECQRRKEMLSRIEADPAWWTRHEI